MDGDPKSVTPMSDAPVRGLWRQSDFMFTGRFVDVDGAEVEFTVRGAITNRPPVAVAQAERVVECDSIDGGRVTLDGTKSSDSDSGDTLRYVWTAKSGSLAGVVLGRTSLAETTLPVGTHEVELLVEDSHAAQSVDHLFVTIRDTTPPAVTDISFTPDCLWPPNHRWQSYLVGEEIEVVAHDACDAALPKVRLMSVSSTEVDEAGGSGSTQPDMYLADDRVCVRAERAGGGTGRLYRVAVELTDVRGNTTQVVKTIEAPHDGSPGCTARSRFPSPARLEVCP